MSNWIIDGTDFHEMPIMKYWQPPSTWSAEKRHAEVCNRIYSNEWIGARKMDGAFYQFIKSMDGEVELIGRSRGVNGDYINKIDWLPQCKSFFDALPNGTCLLGEVVFPENEGSRNTTTIMGCLKDKAIIRQEKGAKLHYYVFDMLAFDGKSYLNEFAMKRFNDVMELAHHREYRNDCVDFAHYYWGEMLWEQLQEILANGGEGMVIMRNDAKYEPGKRPSRTNMKIKKEMSETIDCVIIGSNAPTKEYNGKDIELWTYWLNTQTGDFVRGEYYKNYYLGEPYEPITKTYFNHWAGSFKIGLYRNGEMIHFGDVSGLTDEMKENWRSYVGRVAEVGGMELFKDTAAIRHPKLIQIRPIGDKEPKDCTWDQLK